MFTFVTIVRMEGEVILKRLSRSTLCEGGNFGEEVHFDMSIGLKIFLPNSSFRIVTST